VAEKQPIIVVKKITIAAAGAHGGSWKVAFADFMTAMMAFFLLMWLLNQTPEVKKNVSDYFSTPSVIEYNFSNFGVELTLEKIFLDLVNEPLKVFQDMMTPMDHTPNIMSLGSKNIVMAMMADQLGDVATNMDINSDQIVFEIPETILFKVGTAEPSGRFIEIMDKLRGVTAGLEDANIYVDSLAYPYSVRDGSSTTARKVAEQRMDLITTRLQAALEHESSEVFGRAVVEKGVRDAQGRPLPGSIKVRVKQKEVKSDGTKPRKFDEMFSKSGKDGDDVYQGFVKQITDGRSRKEKAKK